MSLHNLDDLATKRVECPSCGMTPMGEGCYHVCPNSVHFYSPEQEREDDLNWSRTDYMREVYGDPDLDAESDIPVAAEDFLPQPTLNYDDIPF